MNKTCAFVWFYNFDEVNGELRIFSQLRSDCLLGTAGGKSELAESPIETATREIWEELGLPLDYLRKKLLPKFIELSKIENGDYTIHSFGCPLNNKQFGKFLKKVEENKGRCSDELTGTMVFCLGSREKYDNMLSHNFSGTAKKEIESIIALHAGLSWM